MVIPPTFDEEGNLLTEERTESYEVEVPIMESQYVEMTPEEIEAIKPSPEEERQIELESCYQYLRDTDYVACKIAEGVATAEDYAEVLAKRQGTRQRINELA